MLIARPLEGIPALVAAGAAVAAGYLGWRTAREQRIATQTAQRAAITQILIEERKAQQQTMLLLGLLALAVIAKRKSS
ncbi:MAG: hypothetical protein V2G41_09860 [bacterium JZ-2024 1]